MAKKLKAFKFKHTKGEVTHYPWNDWLNGDIWQLTQGNDFKSMPQSFVIAVYKNAKKAGKKVSVAIRGDNVIVQAFDTNGKR